MRVDTVAIGMDFSRSAIAAATWVAESLAPQAKIALVHAIEAPARPPFLVAETMPSEALEIDARAEREGELSELARRLGPNVTRMEVRVGRAAETIAQFAVDAGADLIAVGAHGNRAHRSALLGTTSDTLVRNATIPVLVGGQVALRGRTRVIAAVTDGALEHAVIRWGSVTAGHLGGRLTVVHAIEPAAYSHMASLVAARSQGGEVIERLELNALLEEGAMHWRAEAERCGADASRIDPVVEEGFASDVILRCAAKERAALIVLGRHEGRPLGFARLGRTVRHVLHAARCGVVVLPPA